ncbi:hypothetical protein N5B56_01775 [Eubacterium sp. LFL-14]|jgi:hypothetical protein|uniref:Uncharacterized protein n=1 Tax=Eubacterium album TaxID=2978477 RepID=A0ABT2LYV3_9FIRM|nr:hypothetical protein [Eubacterium sp. LFL-14]MCT7397816.1 hypothetical protein [Eubacterium sp. LFL-14]
MNNTENLKNVEEIVKILNEKIPQFKCTYETEPELVIVASREGFEKIKYKLVNCEKKDISNSDRIANEIAIIILLDAVKQKKKGDKEFLAPIIKRSAILDDELPKLLAKYFKAE